MNRVHKKNVILLIAVFVVLFAFLACSSEKSPSTVTINGDWPYYNSYSDLSAASSLIIEGKVLSISYSIIDYKNAKLVIDCRNDLDNKMLYTVYTVEVIDVFKGTAGQTITLAIIGGRDDRDLNAQKEALDQSGLSVKFENIPVLNENNAKLAEGDEGVFCLHKFGDYYSPINMEQYVFPKGSNDYSIIKDYLIKNEQ